MKFVVTIERTVKETIVYHVDGLTIVEALDAAIDSCANLNKSTHEQSHNIETNYHVVRVGPL